MSTLGANLVRVRTRRGLTQEQLAERAGLARATVVRVERGSDPPVSTVRALALALGVPAGLLIEAHDADHRKPPKRIEPTRKRRTG
jgi:transcriptional regulator with XRE-family HTH domain